MGESRLCIIKADFDVFKVFGYSKGNNRPRRDDCFLIGNYLFVFACYLSIKSDLFFEPWYSHHETRLNKYRLR